MNYVKNIALYLILSWTYLGAMAQTVTDSVKVIYKNNQAVVKLDGTSARSSVVFEDSLDIVRIHVSKNRKFMEKEAENDSDSGIKFKRLIQSHKGPQKHRVVETGLLTEFDIGFANMITSDGSERPAAYENMEMNMGKSVNISLTLLQAKINLVQNKLSLITGFGWNSYYFKPVNKNTVYKLDANGMLTANADSVSYRKNRLDLGYMKIPLLLSYESKPDDDNRSFKVAAGIEYNFSGNADIVRKLGNSDEHSSYTDNNANLKINSTALNAVVKVGYGPVTIFGRYGISDVFKSSAFSSGNPNYIPMSIGISILGV